jgi:DNA-binding MarR family transcriptional regulator
VQAALLHGGYGDILPGHYKVLRHLGGDGARPAELAAHANVTRQAITKAVDELEQLGLVRRDPDPTDGRGVIVRYTDRGLAGLELARQRMLELETEYAKRLGTSRWNDTRAALETLFDDQPAM